MVFIHYSQSILVRWHRSGLRVKQLGVFFGQLSLSVVGSVHSHVHQSWSPVLVRVIFSAMV